MMLLTLMVKGSKMPLLSLPARTLRWSLPPFVSPNASLTGKLCHDDDSIYNSIFVDEQTFLHVYLYKYLSFV